MFARPGTSVSAHPSGFKADISRILKYAPAELIGREDELKLLHAVWSGHWPSAIGDVPSASTPPSTVHASRITHHVRILSFVALGGEGKTSLVAKWAAELAAQDWPGCDAAFAWSFYSQGTREQLASSADLFLKAALTFFGDDADQAFAASPAGAFEKGQRLARLVGQRGSLLILDGLEPLQYAPTSPTPGELKDQGVAALLKNLAAASHGLCVVTTRYSLPDLRAFWQTTAPEVKLLRLSPDAGMHLLKTLGVRGPAREFATLTCATVPAREPRAASFSAEVRGVLPDRRADHSAGLGWMGLRFWLPLNLPNARNCLDRYSSRRLSDWSHRH